jgi:hypothetical protein
MVSIGQVIGESVYKDDFRREFGPIDGAVAVDLDERFAGWKLGNWGLLSRLQLNQRSCGNCWMG